MGAHCHQEKYKQSEAKLLKNYGGLQFKDDNYGIIYTIYCDDLRWNTLKNGGWFSICKSPMWEEYKNHDILIPWKFTEDLIYLIKNNLQDDDFILIIIYYKYPSKYDDNEETWLGNDKDT